MDFLFGYQESKIKPYLKMASQRLTMAMNKKRNTVKVQKREIATLLSTNKEESARIKIEHIIREDYTIESYELIQLFCDLLLERIRLVTHDKTCPHDLLGPVSTIIWCANRIDIEELVSVKNQLGYKYGSKFVKEAHDDQHLMVNDKVIQKLSIQPPTAYLVQEYLKEIAKEYNVSWAPRYNILPDDPAHTLPPTGVTDTRDLRGPLPPSPMPLTNTIGDDSPPLYEASTSYVPEACAFVEPHPQTEAQIYTRNEASSSMGGKASPPSTMTEQEEYPYAQATSGTLNWHAQSSTPLDLDNLSARVNTLKTDAPVIGAMKPTSTIDLSARLAALKTKKTEEDDDSES